MKGKKNAGIKAGEENAGLMDIGSGYGVVFKIEVDHPSAHDHSRSGHARCGGINRDIFAPWAPWLRPLRSTLCALALYRMQHPKHLLAGVVHGIGHLRQLFWTYHGRSRDLFCKLLSYRTRPVECHGVGIGKTWRNRFCHGGRGWGIRGFLQEAPPGKDRIERGVFARRRNNRR